MTSSAASASEFDLLAKPIKIPRVEIPIDIVFHQLHRYDTRAQLKVAQDSIHNLNAILRKLAARRENRRGHQFHARRRP